MIYVFDTNSFQALKDYYPARFLTFWNKFNEAVDNGTVVSVREVDKELSNRNVPEWLLEWAKENRRIFLKADAAEAEFIQRIFQVPHFLSLIGERERMQARAIADPFIIACAAVRGGCVVTQEKAKPNAAKIPNVCDYFEVECTDLEGFLTRMDWIF
jgi:hypothetical protein